MSVRMILFDYDAAPDGIGEYTRFNRIFSNIEEALAYRHRYLYDMYWGYIEDEKGIKHSLKEKH